LKHARVVFRSCLAFENMHTVPRGFHRHHQVPHKKCRYSWDFLTSRLIGYQYLLSFRLSPVKPKFCATDTAKLFDSLLTPDSHPKGRVNPLAI
jgi:hypothetical protein